MHDSVLAGHCGSTYQHRFSGADVETTTPALVVTMSSILGKQTVEEPPFDVLLERKQANVDTSYELRKYGKRFAAACTYTSENDMSVPFSTLARYIGVFGPAQNQGGKKISMTAPVVTSGTKIGMTVPVVTESNEDRMVMKFMLPLEYDDLTKIPKPLDLSVRIEEIPSQTGAVHRYNGKWDEDRKRRIAEDLYQQLVNDGVNITQDYVADNWQFWGYNPPFTIPYFRRNEIWIELNGEQVDVLVEHFSAENDANLGVTSITTEVQPLSYVGVNVWSIGSMIFLGCLITGHFIKSRRSRYSRV